MTRETKGYIYLILAALSYALMGILVKLLSSELTPLWQTFLRLIVSSLLAYFYLLIRKKSILLSSGKDWLIMLFMGTIAYGSSIIAYTYAFDYTTVANVLFILASYPIITTVFASLLLKEKIKRNHFIALFILTFGLILIFNPSQLFTYLLGNIISFYVAITFAFYPIISRLLSKNNHPETITFLSILIGTLLSGVLAIFFDVPLEQVSQKTLLGVVSFGFLNFLAFILVNNGFKLVKASTGTMILMLEAVIGSILAFFFFKETPTIVFSMGALLVLFSVYISVRAR